ncbi:putative OTU-like cysteine protease [Trypanosoma cruzi]|nr:putative OTU-like cysteine protease [Trypanosoma cruzi]
MQAIAAMVREKIRRQTPAGIRSNNTARHRHERHEAPPPATSHLSTSSSRPSPQRVEAAGGKRTGHELPNNTHKSSTGVNDNGDGFGNTTVAPCWLCARPANYHLAEEFILCFSCFRLVIRAYIFPLIDTRERRKSDAAFIAKLWQLSVTQSPSPAVVAPPPQETEASSDGKLRGITCDDTVSVVDPSQANFVMSSSVLRSRTKRGGEGGRSLHSETARFLNHSFWTCPQCTFVNSDSERFCGACQFQNVGTVICSFCQSACRFGEKRVSKCEVTKLLHIVWKCNACSAFNTVDGDRCQVCNRPLIWACSRCTVEQESFRTTEGLRVCRTCGAYNMPLEVMQSCLAMSLQLSEREMQSGVEFGVNDSGTIAEQMRQAGIEEAKERLADRMRQLGVLQVNEQVSDGNCLFRGLANQLFGQPGNHMLLRRLVVDYMRQRAESYSVLFDGEAEWDEYLRNMQQSGVWGDELCLNAAARCFHVNIHVITSEASRWHLVFQHDELGASQSIVRLEKEEVEKEKRDEAAAISLPPTQNSICLFLVYMAPVHYDDVMPFRAPQVDDVRQYVVKSLSATMEKESSRHATRGGEMTRQQRPHQPQQQQQQALRRQRPREVPPRSVGGGVRPVRETQASLPSTRTSPLVPFSPGWNRSAGRGNPAC